MLVTPRFVFIHLPKTAGKFCRQHIIENAGPVLYRGGLHGPIERCPPAFRRLPIVAFVRNPWDWYVSWYYHMQGFGGFNPLYATAIDAGCESFVDVMNFVLDGMEEGTEAAARLDEHMRSPQHARLQGHDLNTSMLVFQRSRGVGMLGWRYLFTVGEDASVPKHIGRFESLVDDLVNAMRACSINLTPEAEQRIRIARPVGEGEIRKKRDYRALYTDSRLVDRVAEKERLIVQKFNYNFE